MRLMKILALFVFLAGAAIVTVALAPTVYGQRDDRSDTRSLTILSGRGASIGVSIREVMPAEAGGQPQEVMSGVLVDEVRPDSPADKAGMKRGDVVVEFDGERVRSARQFSRLVQESAPGRTVKATIVRDGKRSDVQVTPDDERRGDMLISGDFGNYMRDFGRDLGRFSDRLPFDFNFDFDFPGIVSGRRLGVSVNELTSQLADHFGVRDGVLVTSVTEGSPASRAGLKAGDVITSIDGQKVGSREDLLRAMHDADRDSRTGTPGNIDLTIGIVRDKKESTLKATLDSRRPLRGRPA